MNLIKFSHEYRKFPEGYEYAPFKLVHVFLEKTENFKQSMLDYDTEYWNEDGSDILNYPLPKGQVLVLLFVDDCNKVFTTIRRYTPEKEIYYKSKIGEDFKIKIEEESK